MRLSRDVIFSYDSKKPNQFGKIKVSLDITDDYGEFCTLEMFMMNNGYKRRFEF